MEKKFPDPAPFTDEKRPPIALAPVVSNQVKAIGYDPATKTLAVQFNAGVGAIYHYPGVEPEAFEAFKASESLGGGGGPRSRRALGLPAPALSLIHI